MILVEMVASGFVDHLGRLPENTNYPLPEIQKREIQAAILAEEEDIRAIDAEISQVQSAAPGDDLQSRRSMKKDLVAFMKILVSPMKELPNEIIARIFQQYAYGPLPEPNCVYPSPPWYLGHICSRWRGVALSTPSLWNFFFVELTGGDLSSRSFDIAKHLLLRTGQSQFSCVAFQNDPDSAAVARLFDLFSLHSNRLRSLDIDGLRGISSLAGIPQVPFKSLEVLDLSFYEPNDTSADVIHPSLNPLFIDTPCLRRVSILLEMDRGSSHPLSLPLPWHQLTHLNVSNYGLPNFHSTHTLLLQCPNLTNCNIDIPEDIHSPVDLPIINLQRLGSLSLTSKGQRMYGQLLQYLKVPCLKRLTLVSEQPESSWSSDDVVDLLKRSACKLEALKCSLYLSKIFLLDILDETPSLQRLSIGSSEMLPGIVEGMMWNACHPGLRLIESVEEHLTFTMPGLKYALMAPGPREYTSNRTKSIGIDLAVRHTYEKDAWAMDVSELLARRLEVDLKEREDQGFMDYPDGEVLPESLVHRRPYYTEAQNW